MAVLHNATCTHPSVVDWFIFRDLNPPPRVRVSRGWLSAVRRHQNSSTKDSHTIPMLITKILLASTPPHGKILCHQIHQLAPNRVCRVNQRDNTNIAEMRWIAFVSDDKSDDRRYSSQYLLIKILSLDLSLSVFIDSKSSTQQGFE